MPGCAAGSTGSSVDEAGRPVVVDLKTGKSKPTAADLAGASATGAYQLAVQHGGFARVATGERPAAPAGAARPATVKKRRTSGSRRSASTTIRLWIARAGRVRRRRPCAAARFRAMANSYCGSCDVKTRCPLMDEGRPVTR